MFEWVDNRWVWKDRLMINSNGTAYDGRKGPVYLAIALLFIVVLAFL